ncbi:hypothetical protein OC861_006820, partial [Tilletia horrida]
MDNQTGFKPTGSIALQSLSPADPNVAKRQAITPVVDAKILNVPKAAEKSIQFILDNSIKPAQDEGRDLSVEFDKWSRRVLDPTIPPEDFNNKHLTLHIKDNKGYFKTIYKYETDMLWPEVDYYAKKQGDTVHTKDLYTLYNKGYAISPFKSIGDEFIQDGDTIDIGRYSDRPSPVEAGGVNHPLLRLSPVDPNGQPYLTFRGEAHRDDEVGLTLNLFKKKAPGSSTRVRTRVLKGITIESLLLALEEWIGTPASIVRICHNGTRLGADDVISDVAIGDKIELDIFMEQIGGARKPTFENEELMVKPSKDIRSHTRIEVKATDGTFSATIYAEGNGTIRAVHSLLQEHTRVFLDFYQGDSILDLEQDMWLLGATITRDNVHLIEIAARKRADMLDYHPNLAFRGHLWATQVKIEMDEIPIRDLCLIPFGAKLTSWVTHSRVNKGKRPEVYLGAKLLRGDLTVDQLPITIGDEIRIYTSPAMASPTYNGPLHFTRYKEEDYEGPEDVDNEGYVRIEFKVEDSDFVVYAPSIMPFRVIIDFLYEEFGITIFLSTRGLVLVDQTPFKQRMTGAIKLDAGIVARDPRARRFYRTMRLFCTFWNGASVGGDIHGVLSPCSATLSQVVTHQLPSFGRKTIRFLVDGERVPNDLEISGLEVDEDGHVDIELEQEGGGPMNSQGSQDTNPPEPVVEDTPESVQPPRFVADQPQDRKRKDITPPPPHMQSMQFGSVPASSIYSERVVGGLPSRAHTDGPAAFPHTSRAFGMTPSREQGPVVQQYGQGQRDHAQTSPQYARPTQAYGQASAQPSTGYVPPPMPAPEEYYSAASLPRPSVFCGKGVVNFFEKYEAWCNRYKQTTLGRFTNLCFFLSDQDPHNILNHAKKLPSWGRKDYEGVKADLLRTFHEPEDRYTIGDLLALAEKQSLEEIEDLATLISFSFQFKEIANTLVKYNKITDQQYRDTYMIGLGRRLRERMLRRSTQTHTRAINPSFDTIEDDARRVFEPDSYYEQFENRQAQEEARLRHPEAAPVPIMQVANSKTKEETTVKDLADMFKDLIVNLGQAASGVPPQRQITAGQTYGSRYNSYKANVGITPTNGLGFNGKDNPDQRGYNRPTTPLGPPLATPYRGDPARQAISRPISPAGCHYCGQEGHSRRFCPDLVQHKQAGLVRENAEGRLETPDGKLLPWRKGEMKDVVIQYAVGGGNHATNYKSNAATLHQSNAHEYGWYGEEEDYDYDYEEGYESNNAFVAAAEKRGPDDDAPVSRPKRTKGNAPPVNLPSTNHPSAAIRLPTPAAEADELMEDAHTENQPKEKKHKYTLMSDVQKKFNTREALDRLLNHSSVSFSVGEALSLNPDLARGVTQAAARKRTPYFGPLEANSVMMQDQDDGPYYTHGLVMIKVRVEGHDL